MKILIACEFSGVVRRAFRAKGHNAWSCDLLPSEDDSICHLMGNVFDFINFEKWDMMIASNANPNSFGYSLNENAKLPVFAYVYADAMLVERDNKREAILDEEE